MSKYDKNLSTQEVYRRRLASEHVHTYNCDALAVASPYEKGMHGDIYRLQMDWEIYDQTYMEGTYWAVVSDSEGNIVSVFPMITIINGDFDNAEMGEAVGIGKLDDMGIFKGQEVGHQDKSLLRGIFSIWGQLIVFCSLYIATRIIRMILKYENA